MQHQNVGLPSWESFHRTQHQLSLESSTKTPVGRSSLEALATAAARADGVLGVLNTSGGTCSQKSMKTPAQLQLPLKPNPASFAHVKQHVRTNHQGRIPSIKEVSQARQQQQLAQLHEMEYQKVAIAQAQELQNATLMAQAKHAMVVQQQAELQQQAALEEARFVNLVMDYNSPQMQLQYLPQGIEFQQSGLVPQQALIQDPRFFVGNQPHYGEIKVVDGEKNPPPTATLNEHIASVWQKYNRDSTGMIESKRAAESESVPLKKRKMEMHVPLPSVSSMGGQGPYTQL